MREEKNEGIIKLGVNQVIDQCSKNKSKCSRVDGRESSYVKEPK